MPLPATEHSYEESPTELPAVATWVRDGIALPVAALRASLEALAQELGRSGASVATVDGALEGVERMTRNIEELLHWSATPSPRPARCEAGEIAFGARAGLLPEHRSRVLVALAVADDEPLTVDGRLLTGVLRRLAESALEAGVDRVLIAARRDAAELVFTVVHSTCGRFAGLARTICERDVPLAGGSLHTSHTALGDSCHSVRVPAISHGARSA